MDLVNMKSHVLPALTNLRLARATKDQEIVLLVLPAITVPWDQLNSMCVLQAITALRIVVFQHSAEQVLTTRPSEQLTPLHV
jgi:hypothetical protein